ncbi:Alpha-mannosidase 2 [Schistosoma japonicum]|nr:Alpha-mannosidase 2 [Schistosoma japonicum]
MKLRLIRRLCFILMCTVFALYIIMQYYGEPREKNLLTLQFAIKDLHEKSRVSLSMPWLADISVRQKWHDISRLDSPDVVIQSTTKLKSMIDSNQSRRLTIETFQGPVCQQSYYDNTNTTYQMNDIYNHLAFDDQPGGVWTQGFPIEYNMDQWKDQPLEVFIVPFSHQDPGWIKTFEKYFTTETKPNLDATLTTLNKRKEAKFVYSEVSFLNLWVDTLSQDQKEIFKSLLRSGRWEIVSGGWVMPDEAVTHYYSIIDQFIEGHHWLLEHFDYRPNITWSIDPFGQSSTMPYLLKKLGFSQMIINRVHYEVKKYLAHRKSLEFIWHQPWDSTGSHSMFAHMFPFFSYDVPHTCGPEPSVCCQFDFIRINKFGCPWHKPPVLIDDSNIAVRADMLADQYRKKATLYNNNGLVLIPLGDDFRYQTTHEWNIQLDNYNKLIEYINSKASYRMKIRFSTLSNYFQVLNERINKMNSTLFASFPSLSGDFLTYADRQHDYWSGYYNSNPYEKSLSRLLESELRSAEILYSYARQSVGRLQNVAQLIPLITDLYKNLTIVRRNLGLFQHHDAITGTSRPEVMLDYSEKLLKSIHSARKVITISSAYLLLLNSALKSDVVISNKRLPVSNKLKQLLIQLKDEYQTGNNNDVTTSNTISGNTLHSFYSLEDNLHNYQHSEPILIHFSENNNNADIVNTRRIYIFNPSTRNRSTIITLQVKGHLQHFEAKQITSSPTESMDHLNIQLEHSWTNALNSKHHQQQPVSLLNLGPVKLYPLSFSCIELKLTSKSSASSVIQVKPQLIQVANDENIIVQNPPDLIIENKYIQLEFDSKTGYLQKMLNKLTGKSMNMKINFIQYQSLQGESHSGRYLFIPDGLGQPLHNPNSYKYTKGNLVDTVTVYTEYVTHTVRLYKSDDLHSQFIEIENIVNIVVNSPTDIDLFMTIQTDLINKDRAFYTDSNCFQFIRRQYHDKIPLQGNVYPIACGAYLEQEMDSFLNNDNSQTKQFQRLNLFTSYPTGVVSPEIGQINVWIDRRSSRDDLRGAQSNLNGEWILQSRLRLFTEIISIDNTQEKKSVPGLTVFSQQILSDLLRPVHKFYVNQPTLNDLLVTDYHLMPTSGLPCDYELVTMKTFHNSKIPKEFHAAPNTQVGVIIRRLSSVCYAKTLPNIDFYSKCVNDIGQNDELNVQELFGSIQLSHAIQTNLTLIPYSTDRKTKHIHIRPMELEAFYLV